MVHIKIVNVVASTRIKGQIDLEKMVYLMSKVVYEPEIFSGLIYRKIDPKVTLVMFSSGKISSMGSKSEYMAKEVIINTLKEVGDVGCIIGSNKMEEINIENVVGTGDIGYDVDLESVMNYLPNAIYEPDQFPGITYRPFRSNLVCLIFSTGKVVIAGGKSEKEIKKAFQNTNKFLENSPRLLRAGEHARDYE